MRKTDPFATGVGRGRGDVAPSANVPPLEGEVGGDQSGAQISRAATFWAMRSNQFQMGAVRWLAVGDGFVSRFSSRRSAPARGENPTEGKHGR